MYSIKHQPDFDDIVAYLQNDLPLNRAKKLERHLQNCDSCTAALEDAKQFLLPLDEAAAAEYEVHRASIERKLDMVHLKFALRQMLLKPLHKIVNAVNGFVAALLPEPAPIYNFRTASAYLWDVRCDILDAKLERFRWLGCPL